MDKIFEIQFLHSDIKDISALITLLKIENIKLESSHHGEGDMGVDPMTWTIILPSLISFTSKLFDVLMVWLKNRDVEIIIKNQKTQKQLAIKSKNGKIPTKKELENLKSFLG